MSYEEAKRKLKDLIKEVLSEQTPTVQTPKKPIRNTDQGLHELREYLKSTSDQHKVVPKYMYSYADQPSKDILLQLNEDLLQIAKEEATKRHLSLNSYLRESIIHRLYKTPPEKEREIDQLLEDCKGQDPRTLIIEGEKGFLSQLEKRGLTGEVWTFSQIDKVASRLTRNPRSVEEQCMQAMKLGKIQAQYFTTQIDYIRNISPKEEEIWFVPYGICAQCLRPLTKEQCNLPNCPYCKGTRAIPFEYDKESPAQPKPYAMCAKCHRPLPKEAEKWKECKYCGTTDKEIVLNYEGIQRQTPSSTLKLDREILDKVAESETPKETEET